MKKTILLLMLTILVSCGGSFNPFFPFIPKKSPPVDPGYGIPESGVEEILADPDYGIKENSAFSSEIDISKDLEKFGSKIEEIEIESLKDRLVEYGLSDKRTQKVANLVIAYKKISSKRALNAREKNLFTRELLGISFADAAKILVEEGHEVLIEKASEINETSPEDIEELIKTIL